MMKPPPGPLWYDLVTLDDDRFDALVHPANFSKKFRVSTAIPKYIPNPVDTNCAVVPKHLTL